MQFKCSWFTLAKGYQNIAEFTLGPATPMGPASPLGPVGPWSPYQRKQKLNKTTQNAYELNVGI